MLLVVELVERNMKFLGYNVLLNLNKIIRFVWMDLLQKIFWSTLSRFIFIEASYGVD